MLRSTKYPFLKRLFNDFKHVGQKSEGSKCALLLYIVEEDEFGDDRIWELFKNSLKLMCADFISAFLTCR